MEMIERIITDALEKAIKRGDTFYKSGDQQAAAKEFEKASRLFAQWAEHAPAGPRGMGKRQERLRKAEEYKSLAERVAQNQFIQEDGPQPAKGDELDNEITKLIFKSKVGWDEIGGLESTKRDIKYAYGLTMAKIPAGLQLEAWKNMMFYGPPGTGKTMLASAVSAGLDAVFFNVKVSSVLSKYFGESSRIITRLYDTARATAPSVIFLDEFDSITGARGSGSDSGAERRVLSTILAELDGLAEKGGTRYVLTIAATNTPWDVDQAALSRFEKKIYIPLPDFQARSQILDIHLAKRGFTCEVSSDELARITFRFSGREIATICKEAINAMIAEENATIPDVVDQGRTAIQNYELKVRALRKSDFEKLFSSMKPQTPDKPQQPFGEWVHNKPVD